MFSQLLMILIRSKNIDLVWKEFEKYTKYRDLVFPGELTFNILKKLVQTFAELKMVKEAFVSLLKFFLFFAIYQINSLSFFFLFIGSN